MSDFLILRFSSLGDVILATAAARLIRERRPGARIVFATKAAFAPVLASQPDLDEVWPLEQGRLDELVARVRAARFEAVVDLHANLRSRVVSALSGSKVRRWNSRGWNRRLRVWAPWMRPADPGPVARRYAQAAAAAVGGGALEGPAPLPRLGVDPEAGQWAKDWLAGRGLKPGQKLLVVSPGAAWATKRWPPERLAQCLEELGASGRVAILMVGSPAEAALSDAVLSSMPTGGPGVLRAEGETRDLRRLAALVARADHFLGNDSGPMHLAAALGVRVTALFGPTVRAFGFEPQGPGHTVFERELACRPCSVHGTELCPLGHHDCMRGLDPSLVARHLIRCLGLEAVA